MFHVCRCGTWGRRPRCGRGSARGRCRTRCSPQTSASQPPTRPSPPRWEELIKNRAANDSSVPNYHNLPVSLYWRSNFTFTYHGLTCVSHSVLINGVLNEEALLGAFNQKRALVGAFSLIIKSSRTFVARTRGPCTLQRILAAVAAGAEYIMLCECAHCAGMNRTLPRPWTWTPCQPVSHVTAPLRYQICSL